MRDLEEFQKQQQEKEEKKPNKKPHRQQMGRIVQRYVVFDMKTVKLKSLFFNIVRMVLIKIPSRTSTEEISRLIRK